MLPQDVPVYVDGGFARPHDWTPFKEFSRAFEPDYDGGAITLMPDFFDAVDDNREVTLTFHFWSGETVEYSIITSEGSVTGTA
jgi:endoglucanase